ncbi:hypothetical protein [Natronobiforma cellulositropha]|uniref:hypothetical protein n=1 Tax=Natronobiforma cellulositropha TaxID=1679076 RepID=UPI0021D5AF21|nr:hypothetical protein [Natronobiforma cellulositropha]
MSGGLARPSKVPRYLFGLLHPSSDWGPELLAVRERPVEPTWSAATGTDEPPERVLVFRAEAE